MWYLRKCNITKVGEWDTLGFILVKKGDNNSSKILGTPSDNLSFFLRVSCIWLAEMFVPGAIMGGNRLTRSLTYSTVTCKNLQQSWGSCIESLSKYLIHLSLFSPHSYCVFNKSSPFLYWKKLSLFPAYHIPPRGSAAQIQSVPKQRFVHNIYNFFMVMDHIGGIQIKHFFSI